MIPLLTLHYLPKIEWFAYFVKNESVILEQFDNYQKSSLRNRTIINAANGSMTLSIPLKGGRGVRLPYNKVEICYENNWQHQHWLSITSAYGSSPFFEHYADYLKPFYEKQYPTLFDFNHALLLVLLRLLKTKSAIAKTSSFEQQPISVNDLRVSIHASSAIQPKEKYIQVFSEKHGFNPNASVIDLLFNEGPNAGNYLKALTE